MSTQDNIFISINFAFLIISCPGNVFIIVVNGLHFFKKKRLQLSDQLILGFKAFSFLHALHEGYMLYIDLGTLVINEYVKQGKHVLMYVNLSSLWFSALLSTHYCLKIVNINHKFYIRVQRIFPKLFPWIIIAFLLDYFFLSLYSALQANQECLLNKTSIYGDTIESPRCSWLIFIFFTVCGLCALGCAISALTILISLFKHMKRIQENSEGSSAPNMEAHIRAIKTIATLLAANVLISASVAIMMTQDKPWGFIFGSLVNICHIFSSYFLIKGTKHLDQTMVKMLNHCSCVSCKNQ
ncbi:taste receptor type 2 member 9-like [Anomaloglossus baeobatrachus]|uniref:taste receptor type 2 member 9-like n=1 Tax=Anomaloglossus baeobatrachus TaxID=238106 RepID=UPI003F5009A7